MSKRRPKERRRRRQPAATIPPPEELLSLIDQHRGTEIAAVALQLLIGPHFGGGDWRDLDPVMRLVQSMADAGIYSTSAKLYLMAQISEAVLPSRANEEPRFAEVDREIEEVKRAHGLGEDDDWFLDDAPAEYVRLSNEWSEIADRQRAAWFAELGEREMARWLRAESPEWMQMWKVGRDELLGTAN